MIIRSVVGFAGVQRIARPGRVDVAARIARVEPVVGRRCQGRDEHSVGRPDPPSAVWLNTTSSSTSNPASCRRVDHGPEFRHLAAATPGPHRGRVRRMRREEADGVVTPVVRQSPLDEERLGHVVVDGQQFDGGDAEADEVLERRLVRQTRVGAAQLGRHSRDAFR